MYFGKTFLDLLRLQSLCVQETFYVPVLVPDLNWKSSGGSTILCFLKMLSKAISNLKKLSEKSQGGKFSIILYFMLISYCTEFPTTVSVNDIFFICLLKYFFNDLFLFTHISKLSDG